VRDLQRLRGRYIRAGRAVPLDRFCRCADDVDLDRDATLLLDLADGQGAIGALNYAFD
jgi:hypothetical protein